MATQTKTHEAQQALLFMPDITGFTEFVNTTEIIHAQGIIQEVLEIIIESNQINLELGEIEGDAVFFYRLGTPPTVQELLQQVQTMFTRFHHHLQLYDRQRICPCQACSSAVNLKLKIIAHYGEVAGYSVKQHHKLFGRDVIVLHRLLKNNLKKAEYTLMTDPLITGAGSNQKYPDWYVPEEATEKYDVGEVSFKVSDLAKLREQLPEVEIPAFNTLGKTKTIFTEESTIKAPALKVFGAIFDITQRPKWMEGVKGIEMITKDHINRIGTKHRCIISPKDNPVMVTEYARITEDGAELVEMDQKGTAGCRFKIEAINNEETRLKMDMLMKKNFLLNAFFNLFMKTKMKKNFTSSLNNLAELCKEPLANKKLAENLN